MAARTHNTNWTMSKHTKGKELKKGGTKRHVKSNQLNRQCITLPAIKRLARRGGVKRISQAIYKPTREVVHTFITTIVRDSIAYTENGKRKTVTATDVVHALARQGRTLYGFGG